MKTTYLISIILLTGLFACNNSDIEENIDFAKEYPEADAVYLTMTKEYTLNKNGSVDFYYSHKLKLLTHMSFNRLYGETFIVYDPKLQELKINKAETKMADGKITHSPENAFNEVLPRGAANAPAYNHLREMVITHTGLELDAIIDLDYILSSKKRYFPVFVGYEVLSASSPIRELNIIIKVPKGKDFKFSSVNCGIELQQSEENNFKVYSFTMNNIPANTGERNIDKNIYPAIFFSTDNMETVHKKFTDQDAFKFETCKGIDKYIEENKIKKLTILEALKIQKHIVNNVNHYHLPLKYTAYKVRTAAEVWKSNGGTTLEKTLLLTTLFKKYGFEATPMAITENHLFDIKTGNIDIFNEYVVRLKFDDGFYYLSAIHENAQNLKFNIDNRSAISLEEFAEKIIVDEERLNNEIKISGTINIDNKKLINGELKGVFAGECNTFYKLEQDKNSAKSLLSGITVFKANIENSDYNYSNISFKLKDVDVFKEQSEYYFWKLPQATTGIKNWHIDYLSSNRKTSFSVPYPVKEEYEYTIDILENLKLVTSEVEINKTNKAGTVNISITNTETGFKIIRTINIPDKIIPAVVYNDFREILNIWNNKKYNEIVFKEIGN